MYKIGIDGGGTKTSFKLYNEEGECLRQRSKETCHLLQVSPERAIQILREGVNELIEDLADDEKILIGLGLAGYGEDEALRLEIEKVCEKALSPHEYYLFNDVMIALEGALNGEEGILVIAGTGSIALSKKENHYRRVGGWGYMLGDEGSAYWLAKEIFKHYSRQVDGREAKTQLVELIKERFNLDKDYDLISYYSNELKNDRRKVAQQAILLEKLIDLEDPVADKLLDKLVSHLSLLINSLARDFNKDIKVSYLGGVFNLGEALFERLELELSDHLRLTKALESPEKGAVLLAEKEKLKGAFTY